MISIKEAMLVLVEIQKIGESMDHKEDEEIILEKNGIKGSG